jgi:hypothetical protein
MSIVRWLEPTKPCKYLPSELTAFAGFIFSSSGLVNVCLFVITRPGMLPSLRRAEPEYNLRDNVLEASSPAPSVLEKSTTQVQNVVQQRPQIVVSVPMLAEDDGIEPQATGYTEPFESPRSRYTQRSSWISDQSPSMVESGASMIGHGPR